MNYTMIKRFFILLLAIVASVGMSYALTPLSGDVWDGNARVLTVNSDPGDYYYDQSEIKRLVISNSVTEIGENAFNGCANLESVFAYDGLQTIDNEAFAYCPKLESVILPASTKYIGTLAFSFCDNLKYVTINAQSLTYYGAYAFNGTHAVKIYVPEASLAAYKTSWSDYADKFQAIPSSLAVGDTLKVGDAMYSATDVYVDAGYLRFQIKASFLHTISAISVSSENIKVEFTPYAEEFYPSGSYAALTNWFYCSSEYTSGDVTEITVVSGTGTLDDPFVIDYVVPTAPAYETVMNLIDAIGTVELTAECKAKIDAARAAYNALSAADKDLVTNIATLTQAETDYAALNQAEADKAIAKINAIPSPMTSENTKLSVYQKVQNARAAYDALTAEQKALVEAATLKRLTDAEDAFAAISGGAAAGALSGKFTINADGDQIAFAKGNLQATTTDLGEHWTWGFAANQWDLIGNAAANNAVNGNGTVSENGTVDLFGWSTPTTYYGIHNSKNNDYYSSDFREWGENITGAEWKTPSPNDWIYIISNRADAAQKQGQATVNGVNGYIFLPDEWELPTGLSFTAKPNNWTANVYDGDDWTAMENAGAVFLPKSPWRSGNTVTTLTAAYYWSSDYNNSYMAMAYSFQEDASIKGTGINRYAGIPVRLVTAGGASPIADAQAAVALINAIPAEVTLDDACKDAIDAARAAVDALGANASLIDAADMTKLTDAEQALKDLNQAEADKVIAKINAIPTPVTLKLATRDSIESARAAYEALNADQKLLVSNYQTLTDAEAALEAYVSLPDGALNGQFTINAAGDVISFAKGNLQATTADLGEHWTWGVAANQWEVIGAEVANTAIIGSGQVSANGTVDMFGWSTPATYFGIYHTMDGKDYLGDFVDWGTNLGAGWRTLAKDEWAYLLKTRENAANLRGQATVNGVHGMILLPNDWTTPTGLTFTAMPNNWITNVYADADWNAMEEAGAVFLPIEGVRWEQSLYSTDGGSYWSSTPAEDAQSAEYVLVNEETPILGGVEWLMDYGGRDNGISVRLAAFSVNPFDDAQAVKDMIDALPNPIDYFSKDAIKAARAAYDALGNETKAALDEATVQHLIDAENQWAAIAAKIEQNVYYIGKDGELKNEKVALLNIPDPAPDFNGYEFDKWKVKTGRFLEEGLRIKALYTPIITTDPVAYDTLVFNRADQELVVAGIAKEGHIEYRIGEGEWSAELPKAMNAGTYVVTYKLVRDGHDDYISPNQISVTIAKTQVSFDAPAAYDTLTYNYNAQTLIVAGQTLDGTFEYTLDPTDAQSWSTDLPQGMNAGLYGVNFRVIGDMNHFDSIVETPIEIQIAKRDIIVTAPAAYDTLVYNAQQQTLAADGTADFNTMEYTLTPNDDNSWLTTMPTALNAGSYDVYYRVQGDANHNDFEPQHIAATIAQAPLTITAIDSTIVYGDEAPEFFASYSGWQGDDNESVVSGLAYTCAYEQGSYVGTYAITPNSATSLNYAMTFVEGTLTVVKAAVYVSDAEVHIAKFEDNNTDAEVTDKGVLNGVKLNDPLDHITTASFSSADVAEHLTITLFYELTGDSALLENYYLSVTSEVYTEEGVIIEQILPDNDHQPGETEQVEVKEGIDVYVFGYCDGSGYSLKYHLNRGIPDQYMIDFEDSRFTDVDWTNLETPGKDGTIFVEIPVDLPTGDYNMSVQFRDSRFDWLESRQFDVTFHVNLPETYTMPLFGNAIALVDTCNCFTDIQWYYRATPTDVWEPIPGATGYYCHVDGQLTGEYFVAAKMNGVETFTCPQTDMETLYEDDIQHVRVRAYPNPVIDKTNVVIENASEWNHNLRIVNLMGVEMMTTTFEGNETSVEMGNYPQGNYMISVDGIVVKVMKK